MRSGCGSGAGEKRVQCAYRAGAEQVQSRCRGGAEEVQSGCADLSRAHINLRQHLRQHRIGGSALRRVQNAQRRAHAQRVEAHVLARGAPPVAAHGHRHVQRT